MDTRFLETFLLAVDTGSIAEAARRLHLTAAAVAKRIRALENDIGAPLVRRSGRTVMPTKAGVAIIEHANRFLAQARDFKSLAAADHPSGELRLGAFQSALTGLLPDILKSIGKKYPQVEVHTMRGSHEELYGKVIDGALDAAIIVKPPFAIPKGFDWRLLREEPLMVLASTSVASRDAHTILASEPFIRLTRNSWTGRLVDLYLRKAGIKPLERIETGGVETITVMVDRGLGVSLLPDWAPPWPEGLSIVKLPVPDDSFTRYVGLIWARASLRLPLVHVLLEEAAAVAWAQMPRQTGRIRKARRN
jgi:DNA-binding transcriptional LysR family regulator